MNSVVKPKDRVDELKKQNKDTLFKYIFTEKPAFIDLYEACSGKRLKEGDLTRFDLNTNEIKRERYNDVSFITSDNKALILVEHQSTLNQNMAMRMLLYYSNLVSLYLSEKEQDLNKRLEVPIPEPEFFVVYNGKEKLKSDIQSFKNEFLEVKVPILDIHLEKLKNKGYTNYLAGYSYFFEEFNKTKQMGLSPEEAFVYARKSCIEKGYLKGFIEKEDFVMMTDVTSLLSYDRQLIEQGKEEGRGEAPIKMLSSLMELHTLGELELIKIAKENGISRETFEGLKKEVAQKMKNETVKTTPKPQTR